MASLTTLSKEDLEDLHSSLWNTYKQEQTKDLHLNMSRGKPSAEQLDLSMELVQFPKSYTLADGTDARNYGVLQGIGECRRLFGDLLDIPADQIIMGGNASLNLMFDTLAFLLLFGTEGKKPWADERAQGRPVKFLCPVPGYDRHFTICEELGVEMIPVPLLSDGPDMDLVTRLVKEDEQIKGIWCVPLHSNPQGVCYSDKTVDTLASMTTAADDFRIFWDNAYGVHHIYEEVPLKNILKACEKAGYPNRCYYFFSTSKITFPGAGVSLIASSPDNVKELLGHMSAQTISHDKLNQLRHVQFFGTSENIHNHMTKLAALLKPKFDIVLQKLQDGLGASPPVASWSHPKGGYFVSLNVFPGCAKRTVALAKEAGVTLTGAGASYPYGKDPKDSNIRIAPSYPSVGELSQAMDILILCVKLAYIENKLGIQPK